jgi:glycosyltransferase involved in cell wall biosynthesis
MRVCYFNYEWDLGASTGAATQIAQTTAGLERLGHRVLVVDRHRKPPGWPGNGRPRSLTRWLWEPANYARSLTGVCSETALLREVRPDVVLTLHALRFSSLVAARRLGIPAVLQVNASVPLEIRRYKRDLHLSPRLPEWVEGRTLAAAQRVIAVSRVLKEQLTRCGVPPGSITVAPNGADPQRFSPEAFDPALRDRFSGRILAGFAGSFASFHGLDLLEEAVVRSSRREPSMHFLFAGPGPGAARLQARLREQGCHNATFLGHVRHELLPGVLAAADILLAPYPVQTEFYFSPLKLFEYMSCGRAVLAAGLGQIAEVIQDGENGVLYDAAAPHSFCEKLLRLARSPEHRTALGKAARRTILQQYTWEHNARLVAGALEAAAGASS